MLLLLLGLVQALPQDLPESSQLLSLVKGLHSETGDVSFVYEGSLRLIGPESIIGKPAAGQGDQFQGSFSYREADGATLIDMYRVSDAPRPPWLASNLRS